MFWHKRLNIHNKILNQNKFFAIFQPLRIFIEANTIEILAIKLNVFILINLVKEFRKNNNSGYNIPIDPFNLYAKIYHDSISV